MNNTLPINPQLVAAKLAAIGNYEQPTIFEQISAEPRLVELLWFIQAMSIQPGGLKKFVEDFTHEFAKHVGTASMVKAGEQKAEYSIEQATEIWSELPFRIKDEVAGDSKWFTDLILENPDSPEYCEA